MTQSAPPRTLTRPLPVRIAATLLALQSVALLAVSGALWLSVVPLVEEGDLLTAAPVLDALLFIVLFVPLSILGLVGALGLVLRRRSAWSLAMVIQAAIQGVSLYFYFGLPAAAVVRTGLIYAVMATGIVVVLYLNSADVRLAFRRTRHPFDSHPDREAPHEFTA